MPVQRRLAAILVADVVGYSRMMAEDEEGTLATLTAHLSEMIEPCIAEHSGRVVKTTGDGLLAEFASVVDAVRCAVAFQEGMAERNAGTPEDRRIVFRIGVNLGDVIVQDGDVYGEGVNAAARLEGLAEPGGVVVSGTVHEHVRSKLDIGFDDLGPQEVKNIAEPVRAYGVATVSSPTKSANAPLPLPDKPSIAVLPFANMSGDPEQEYFSDGITEDIIPALSRIRQFFVIARNTTFTYKGQAVDVQGRQGVGRALRAGRQRAQSSEPRSNFRPAHRRHDGGPPVGGEIRPGPGGRLRVTGRNHAHGRRRHAAGTRPRRAGTRLAEASRQPRCVGFLSAGPVADLEGGQIR